ncbi:MAG: hypothetical protein HRU09_21165 [Oligoflexales bacterium]|nr:hypothetical protein [Oligoflexales bacterium]
MNACGGAAIPKKPAKINYFLERSNTNTDYNFLRIEIENDDFDQYTFSMGGLGFTSEVNFDERMAIRERTRIEYQEEAIYTLGLIFYNKAGTVFIDDTLAWEYSLEKPPKPIISFTEEATNDDDVTLLLGGNLSRKSIEIWVEGDVLENPEGKWYEIPADLRLPIKVSSEDGIKELTVKYRNIYSNEGEAETVEILRKNNGPTDCDAQVGSNVVSSRDLRVYVSANNQGPMYWEIIGDVDTTGKRQFINTSTANVRLIPEEGEKKLQVLLEDAAGNKCNPIPINVYYSPGGVEFSIKIENDLLVTEDTRVNIVNYFPHLPVDVAQMYTHGPHVVETELTQKWVEFQETVEVTLTEVEGHRDIYVQFRRHPAFDPTPATYTHIYLRPYIAFNNNHVTISDIADLEYVTITGCSQTYQQVAYQSAYPCDVEELQVTAEFVLSDQSKVTKSLIIP